MALAMAVLQIHSWVKTSSRVNLGIYMNARFASGDSHFSSHDTPLRIRCPPSWKTTESALTHHGGAMALARRTWGRKRYLIE
jgi:hypothetical protein